MKKLKKLSAFILTIVALTSTKPAFVHSDHHHSHHHHSHHRLDHHRVIHHLLEDLTEIQQALVYGHMLADDFNKIALTFVLSPEPSDIEILADQINNNIVEVGLSLGQLLAKLGVSSTHTAAIQNAINQYAIAEELYSDAVDTESSDQAALLNAFQEKGAALAAAFVAASPSYADQLVENFRRLTTALAEEIVDYKKASNAAVALALGADDLVHAIITRIFLDFAGPLCITDPKVAHILNPLIH